MRATLLVLLLALVAPPSAAEPVDFAHDVVPLLAKHCAKCHTAGRYEGDVSFDTRETLLDAGAAEPGAGTDSLLIDRVTSDDPDYRMPPEGPALTAAEIDVLRRWIDEGLAWEPGFSFRKSEYDAPLAPRRPEMPPAEPGVENPIDRIVLAYWREHRISPPIIVDDATFFRRASLDLVGLLPAEGDVAFGPTADGEPAQGSAGRRRDYVRRLLADRVAYADHWMSFWNDLLRNDYAGTGYIDGGREQITAWLYKSLVDDKRYDQFVRELISPRPESSGFGKGIVWRGQVNASQRPALQFAQNVGHVFLGINLKCASCHDSFVDHWKLADAYGLAAIISDGPLELHRCDKPTGEMASVKFLFPELGAVDPAAPREERLRQLADLMTDPQNGRLTRTVVNRLWHRLMGRGIVHPVDSMGTPPWSEDVLDYLAVHLADSGYDLKQTLELIATSQVYALQTVAWDEATPAADYVFAGPSPKRMTAEQFCDALARLTGVAPEVTDNDGIFLNIAAAAAGTGVRPFVRASLIEWTPLMRTLGRPNREQVVTTRPTELTTLEALELSNGKPLSDLLRAGAESLLAKHEGASAEGLCRNLVRTALCREPTDKELSRFVELTGETPTVDGLADALWCLVMLPEFQIIR